MRRKLVLGILIFVVLPLLAWGITDIPGFYANPARLAYLGAIAAIQAIAAIWFPEAMDSGSSGEKLLRRQAFTVKWLQLVSFLLVVGAPFCDRRDIGVFAGEAVVRYPGLALAIPGFLLMLWARVALGRQFSIQVTVQHEHRLVTGGLYRHLRHPRYAGIMLYLFGTALVYRSWIGVALASLTVGVLLWRIRDEEALMHREFGQRWEDYCRRTRRLIPLVY